MTLECEECSQSFEPRNGGKKQKYCSGACRRQVALRNLKNRQALALSQRLEKLFCRQCGEKIYYKGCGAIPIFCTEKCKTKFHNTKNRRGLPSLKLNQPKDCEFCGKTFMPKKRDAKYCPDSYCPQKAYERRKELGEVITRSFDVVCDGCGTKFVAKKANGRWCSKLCANRHWGNLRAKGGRVRTAGDYSDREIFIRDNWICHLCQKPIDQGLSRTDPMGATIDHVLPLSKGGDDSLGNVKAAHWSCNRAKGASVL